MSVFLIFEANSSSYCCNSKTNEFGNQDAALIFRDKDSAERNMKMIRGDFWRLGLKDYTENPHFQLPGYIFMMRNLRVKEFTLSEKDSSK